MRVRVLLFWEARLCRDLHTEGEVLPFVLREWTLNSESTSCFPVLTHTHSHSERLIMLRRRCFRSKQWNNWKFAWGLFLHFLCLVMLLSNSWNERWFKLSRRKPQKPRYVCIIWTFLQPKSPKHTSHLLCHLWEILCCDLIVKSRLHTRKWPSLARLIWIILRQSDSQQWNRWQ